MAGVDTVKTCTKCHISMPLASFHLQRAGKFGRRSWCRACCAEHSRSQTYRRDRQRAADLRRNYDISTGEYESMLEAQNGLCAICGEPETRRSQTGEIRALCVDHDHMTGSIRGLLCAGCNVSLGHYERWFQGREQSVQDYLTSRMEAR